jgi:hypothetical protein
MTTRWLPWISTLLSVIALALAWGAWRGGAAEPDSRERMLDRMQSLVAMRQSLLSQLSGTAQSSEGASVYGAYLNALRRDGLPPHEATRQRLASLAECNTALLAIFEIYLPMARTDDLPRQLDPLRAYVLTASDRWNSVMSYFMAGGAFPATDAPFPEGFKAALEAEVAANR